ncbi:MAG: thermonuclease family protein [Candidatus Coatesbacteria bacterium]|nr:MAG: thermonuclease family protein [Candidatus Coatesbacteria bacterium]
MSKVQIFWDPKGLELDSIGTSRYWNHTDGDTTSVITNIRMLSIDTPELHYEGHPHNHDGKLKQLADWIYEGHLPLSVGLSEHLHARLATGTAGTLQEQQGEEAKAEFERLVRTKLTKPNGDRRPIRLVAAEQHFDQYNRLLAYVFPRYTKKESWTMSPRELASLNFYMVESGWAALFPVYPSLPRHLDLVMFQEAAKEAYEIRRGAWAERLAMPGYEYRMCLRLHKVAKKVVAGEKVREGDVYGCAHRFCVDVTTKEIFYPVSYYKVEPYNRLFVWPEHVVDAVGKLNLLPPG